MSKNKAPVIALRTVPLAFLMAGAIGWIFLSATPASSISLNEESLLPPLARPITASDAFPSEGGVASFVASSKIEAASSRRVMSHSQGDAWVAKAGDQICLVVAVPGPAQVVGSSCTSPLDFQRLGTGLALEGPDGALELHLVSTDAVQDIAEPGPREGIAYQGLVRRPVSGDPGMNGFGRAALID